MDSEYMGTMRLRFYRGSSVVCTGVCPYRPISVEMMQLWSGFATWGYRSFVQQVIESAEYTWSGFEFMCNEIF